jgi:hypothetical protein
MKVKRHFGETFGLRLQDRQSRALLATSFHAGFLLGLFLDPEDEGDMFL